MAPTAGNFNRRKTKPERMDAKHGIEPLGPDSPDGRTVTSGPVQPWTWQIAELFKVEKGTPRCQTVKTSPLECDEPWISGDEWRLEVTGARQTGWHYAAVPGALTGLRYDASTRRSP